MKLLANFSHKKITQFPKLFAVTKTHFIFYSQNILNVLHNATGEIKKFPYENLTAIKIYNDFLLLCSVEIFVLKMENFEIIDVFKSSKAQIVDLSIIRGDSVDILAVTKLDGKCYLYKIFSTCSGIYTDLLVKFTVDFIPTSLSLSPSLMAVSNSNQVYVYDYKQGRILTNKVMEGIVSVEADFNHIFVGMENGDIMQLETGKIVISDHFCNLVTFKKMPYNSIDHWILCDSTTFYIFNTDFNLITKITLNDIMHGYNSICTGRKKRKKSPLAISSLSISTFSNDCILTEEGDFIFHTNFTATAIFSFNSNITDLMQLTNDQLIYATTTGCIKISNKLNFPIFTGKIVELESEPICSLSSKNGFLISVSKSGRICVLETNEFEVISSFNISDQITVTSFSADLEHKTPLLAVGTDSGILFLLTVYADQIEGDSAKFSFKIVFKEKIHEKSISAVKVTERYVISGSYDKKLLIFSRNNFEPIKRFSYDKLLSISSDNRYLFVSSHKQLWIFDHNSLELLKSYSIKKPVLSTAVIHVEKSTYFVAVSDTVRIYSKEKFITCIPETLVNAWALNYPYVAGENAIARIETEMTAVVSEKEREKLKDAFLLKDNFVGLMKIEEDPRKQFEIFKKAFYYGDSNIFKETLKGCKNIGNLLVRNGQYKDIEIFNSVLESKFIKENINIEKRYKRDILRILNKQYEFLEKMEEYFK
ncbi:hypothetical protein NUSPORA_02560 [Nucleospora cyclopteri]